jgi:tRNA A37 threonylcarbamoyltransferase TsaD
MSTGKEKDKEPAPEKEKVKAKKPKEEKGVLETAAEAIGTALGTIAKTTGIGHTGEKQVSKKIGKLQKKNKQRTPRKAKKKAAKALGSPGGK